MKIHSLTDIDATGGVHLALMGMSGVGKTHIANILRQSGNWYHYSVDYRLGRHYLAPHIDDLLRIEAMKSPMFSRLLRADAMTLRGKFSIANLDVMTDYLGKLGDVTKGGIDIETFLERQEVHRAAEVAAMADANDFIRRAHEHYGYRNFICDCSGSLCSVVDPDDPTDPVLSRLASRHVLVYLDIEEADIVRIIDRFKAAPKPIFYSLSFFGECASDYLDPGQDWQSVDPDDFAAWAFERIVGYRLPRYRAIADGWGYRIPASALDGVKDASTFLELLEEHITAVAA